jgi:transketolase
VHGWFSDDTPKRFEAYGWEVIPDVDGHNAEAIKAALVTAAADPNKPTLICCKTQIGFGSPAKAGSESSHGAPLGKDEIAATRAQLGWTHAPFVIPEDIYAEFDARVAGAGWQREWESLHAAYRSEHPALAAEFDRRLAGELPADFASTIDALIADFNRDGGSIASRKASQRALEVLVPVVPELIGGSADLAHSNYSIVKASRDVQTAEDGGNYVYYGVREFGMTAIANGLALHGGVLPFTATFLVFSDYARNAVRMSALMHARVVHVYTHDSIGLGEDGPTHQPVEHLASLRYIPNNRVWRPADAVESAVAWKCALERRDGPSCLAFSRQNLQHQTRTAEQIAAIRVVSMPCAEAFDAQPLEYRESVLPRWCRKRVAIEAAIADYWRKYVGLDGDVIGMQSFGASAPDKTLYAHFGFGIDRIIGVVRNLLVK